MITTATAQNNANQQLDVYVNYIYIYESEEGICISWGEDEGLLGPVISGNYNERQPDKG